jgi:hypothetical protein
MAPFLFVEITLRESAKTDHAAAMSLDQPVKNRNRVTLSPVEQSFRSRNEIGQSKPHESITRSRL